MYMYIHCTLKTKNMQTTKLQLYFHYQGYFKVVICNILPQFIITAGAGACKQFDRFVDTAMV